MKPSTTSHSCFAMAALLVVPAFSPTTGSADEVKIGGAWYRDVTIEAVDDGQMHFVLRSGTQVTRDLVDITGIKVQDHPDVGKSHEALEKKDDPTALSLLVGLKGKLPPSWLRDWVTYQRMGVLARQGESVGVVEALLELVRHKADAFYFKDPPVAAMETADAATAQELQRRLANALRSNQKGNGAAALRAMIAVAKAAIERRKEGPAASTTGATGTTPGPSASKPAVVPDNSEPGADPARSAVVLTRALDRSKDDPITRLLRRGEFDAALQQANEQLQTSGRSMPRRLYQRGMARLALAERQGDVDGDGDGYKSAGLDFMRVVIYFPKSTGYVGASLLEAGFVHTKIGRPDIAAKLFERAGLYLGGDEPELSARLDQLRRKISKEK